MTAPREAPPAQRTGAVRDPRRWRALWVTLLAGFMSLLDVSIVSVALPSVQRDLGASPAEAQWVVSGYALTFGLALVPAGRLGDVFGRRRMFLLALAAFVACSVISGAAPTIVALVAARIGQGLAAGCIAPQNSGLIQQMFSGSERARAFGLFGAIVSISTAVGPIAGGLILGLAGGPEGWRWIFFINLPIGLVALVLAARLLPRGGTGERRSRIDLLGVLLLGSAVFAVLLPLAQAESDGLRRLWWLFAVAVLPAVAFAMWERWLVRRGGDPLLDPRLLTQTPGFASGIALATAYFIGFSGVWLVFALFFQTGLGDTPLQSGLAVTPFAIGSAVSSAVGGWLVVRLRRWVTVIGLAAATVGFAATAVVLLLVPVSHVLWAVGIPLLVGGLGGGLVISPNITMTLRKVPVQLAGSAGGALQTGQRVGAAIGTAALPGIYYMVLTATEGNVRFAVAAALAGAVAAIIGALVLAVLELRNDTH